jgi:anti-anti-sigma factor
MVADLPAFEAVPESGGVDGPTSDPVLITVVEVDRATGPDFEAELAAGFAARDVSEGDVLTVDLSRVRFLDSTGVAALVVFQQKLQAVGADLRVVNATGVVARVLEVTGVAERFAD